MQLDNKVVNLLNLSAAVSFGAAIVHAFVIPEHFEEWWGYGAFFLVVTIAQAVFCGLILSWTFAIHERENAE